MATSVWNLNGHRIQLTHAYWSGKATIWVDDELIFARPSEFIDFGFAHCFDVGDTPVAVRVDTTGITFRHHMLSGPDALAIDEANRQPISNLFVFCLSIFVVTILPLLICAGLLAFIVTD